MASGSIAKHSALALLALVGSLAAPPRVFGSDPVPVSVASARVETLSRLLRRPDGTNEEIIAAIDALVEGYVDLGPGPAAPSVAPGGVLGGAPGAADAAFQEEAQKFRTSAERELIEAFCSVRVPLGSKQNVRHPVQVRAAAAIRRLDPEVGPRFRTALEIRILPDSSYEREPVFYEQAFATLAEFFGPKAFDWLIDRAVNADQDTDSTRKTIAGLRQMIVLRGVTGEQRRKAFDRIHGIYQMWEYGWINKYEAVGGYRPGAGSKFHGGKFMDPPYWTLMRPLLMDTLRILGTDPRTGLPPLDPKGVGDVETFTDYVNWYAGHHTAGTLPWVDPKASSPDGEGPDGPNRHVRTAISIYWRQFGAPWVDWWRRNRRLLSMPAAARTAAGAAAEEAFRAELREKTLPTLVDAALFDRDREVRATAAIALARLGAKGSASRLLQLVTEERSQRVREAAALALSLLPGADFVDPARRLVADRNENPRVRAHAILALGAAGDTAWLEGWLRAARPAPVGERDVLPDLEACAVRALSLSGDAKEAAALGDILSSKKHALEMRGAAASALAQILCPDQRRTLLGMVKAPRPPEAEIVPQTAAAIALPRAVDAHDAAAIKEIRAYLEHDQGQFGGVRCELAIALGRIGGPDAEALLVDAYPEVRKDTTRYAERGWFLLGLGLSGGSAAQTVLRGELRSLEDEQDADAAAIALAMAGSKTLMPEIRERVKSSTGEFTGHGLVALALLGDPEAATLAREALAHRSDSDLLREGALALALTLGPDAAPDLAALWDRCRLAEETDAVAWAYRFAAGPASVAFLVSVLHDAKRPALERAYALAALSRMTAKDDDSAIDRLARDLDPYAISPTLTAIGRSRDVPFLE